MLTIREIRSLQQCCDGRPGSSAAVAAREQAILSCNCLRSDGALDDVGVELDAAVEQEAFEDGTARDSIADRLGQFDLPEIRRKVCCQRSKRSATTAAEACWRAATRASGL
ncbi:UNVERIFIED_ORG: hypothetical protein M2195_004325 [Bradyrhizobium japonicum]|uniref:Uncharacterized protein n=1 Tax=Bradyrhizobium japonicum TaxID=375 RepID=A0A1L3FPX8_BRAJP|nr:hypothetical protein RN69_39740 [Bradyrhizobium japonicum]AND87268.1 hypothetical protein AAV28_05110 [Bradyrhizobium diazoefficiens USDA 110]APG15356.1 hypothetical protein BKD09_44410 [Bradyrhizobium japonicum]KMJ93331.1 hypothetical protein CF64_43650 [Bradyrhizobium japonicum]